MKITKLTTKEIEVIEKHNQDVIVHYNNLLDILHKEINDNDIYVDTIYQDLELKQEIDKSVIKLYSNLDMFIQLLTST